MNIHLTSAMMRFLTPIVPALAVALATHPAAAQQDSMHKPPADVPPAVAAPASLQLVLFAHAKGSQIYTCQTASDGKLAWALKAPEADLFDGQNPDKMIGHHTAGPSWMLDDGSKVTGKAAAHVDSPEVNSIPWLLVTVVNNDRKGLLARVTTIQRLNTRGGKAPEMGCDDAHRAAESRSSYTADYYFYAPNQ